MMTILVIGFWALPAPVSGLAPGHDPSTVRGMLVDVARLSRHVPPSLALAVAETESGFRADAESPAGARGVMQIMPATGSGEFGAEPDQLWDPHRNIRIGVAFLDRLIERYGGRWDLALSHYNGGSRVGSGSDARVIPATRSYVDTVLRRERQYAVSLQTQSLQTQSLQTQGPRGRSGPGVLPDGLPDPDAARSDAAAAVRSWRPLRPIVAEMPIPDATMARPIVRRPSIALLGRLARAEARFRTLLRGATE